MLYLMNIHSYLLISKKCLLHVIKLIILRDIIVATIIATNYCYPENKDCSQAERKFYRFIVFFFVFFFLKQMWLVIHLIYQRNKVCCLL